MGIYEYKTRLEFADINENNQLTQKGLLRILGEAASIHSEVIGYGPNTMSKTHLSWMVLHWKLQIFKTPSWHSEILVKTWPRTFNKIFSCRDFEVYDKDNNLVAIASSKWVLIDIEKHSICRISPEMANAYGIVDNSVFDIEVNNKGNEPKNSTYVYDYTIKRRDIDTNHHVNNLYYLDFAYDALPENIWDKQFNNLEIIYKKQIKLGDTIKCFYTYDEIKNHHIVTIKSEDLQTVHSIVKIF